MTPEIGICEGCPRRGKRDAAPQRLYQTSAGKLCLACIVATDAAREAVRKARAR